MKCTFHEDNQTMIRVCETGRNPTMRHLGRTHYVQVGWLKERFASPDLKLIYEPSSKQAADIYTKGFVSAQKWSSALKLVNIYTKEEQKKMKMNIIL